MTDFYQSTAVGALQMLYAKILAFLPNLLAAIIVLIIGWLLAIFLGKLIQKVLEAIKIDMLANQLGLHNLSEKVGKKLSFSGFGAWLVKWFFFIASFVAAADILGLPQVSTFLYDKVLGYAGNVVVAMAILLLGMLAANFLGNLVNHTVKAGGLHNGTTLGSITKWAVLVFAIITALSQMQIASLYLEDLYKAVFAMLAIAGGIAFGLGGKDHARKVLDVIEEDLKN